MAAFFVSGLGKRLGVAWLALHDGPAHAGRSVGLNGQSDHEAYMAPLAPKARARLQSIQLEVERRLPDAERTISYGMPAYRLKKTFFYFASFKKHVGVYPPVGDTQELDTALAPYRGPKGNLLFPHAQPLPVDLIGRVAEVLAKQYGG
jgi:uncharacterized protein YdhG (YjbR/CyaY superfamily)